MFLSTLIQLENGPNEFYFTNQNGNISPSAVNQPGSNRKDKMKNITELHESEGNKKIKLKKMSFIFFFNFQKSGSGGSVKPKIKKSLA